MNIQKFQFNDVEIEFDLRQGKNMMVNATEMAKVFGETVEHFTRLDTTKKFIESCLKNPYMGFLGIENEGDLIISKQKSGTWMHEVLALKFAAWLNSDFDVWVFITIRNILYEFAHEIEDSISESIRLQREQDSIKNKLAKENPEFMKYLTIQDKINNSRTRRRLATKNKFREVEDLFSQSNKQEE